MNLRKLAPVICSVLVLGCSAPRQPGAVLQSPSPPLLHEEAPKAQPVAEIYPNVLDRQAQDLLMNQDLIRFAGTKSFASATHSQRFRMLRRWCRRHMGEDFRRMSAQRQHNVIVDLESGLDDMLAQRDF